MMLFQVLCSPLVTQRGKIHKSVSREISSLGRDKTMSPVPDAGMKDYYCSNLKEDLSCSFLEKKCLGLSIHI